MSDTMVLLFRQEAGHHLRTARDVPDDDLDEVVNQILDMDQVAKLFGFHNPSRVSPPSSTPSPMDPNQPGPSEVPVDVSMTSSSPFSEISIPQSVISLDTWSNSPVIDEQHTLLPSPYSGQRTDGLSNHSMAFQSPDGTGTASSSDHPADIGPQIGEAHGDWSETAFNQNIDLCTQHQSLAYASIGHSSSSVVEGPRRQPAQIRQSIGPSRITSADPGVAALYDVSARTQQHTLQEIAPLYTGHSTSYDYTPSAQAPAWWAQTTLNILPNAQGPSHELQQRLATVPLHPNAANAAVEHFHEAPLQSVTQEPWSAFQAAEVWPTSHSVREQIAQPQRLVDRLVPSNQNVPGPSTTGHVSRGRRYQRREHTIRPAVPGQAMSVQEQTVQTHPRNRGGRRGQLGERRQRVAEMRRSTACWVCALQRDPCSEGEICHRCLSRSQRAQAGLLPCIRSHLKDMVTEFLPQSMTSVHRQTEVQSFVHQNVYQWSPRGTRGIEVRSTCGCGPDLSWEMVEFQPRREDFHYHWQYDTEPDGSYTRVQTRSPPLGSLSLESGDEAKVNGFVDSMLTTALPQFANHCFEGEDPFQTQFLALMTHSYSTLPGQNHYERELKRDLESVLRLMIITFIMCRTLTIAEDDRVRVTNSSRQNYGAGEYSEFTSPRMGNMQLKFFFAIMRDKMYEKTSQQLDTISRSGGNKKETWMRSFCIILGIALVSEQCQRLLHLQASDRQIRQKEPMADPCTECKGIDERFDFLVRIFHSKYKIRRQPKAKFEDYKGCISSPAERSFMEGSYQLAGSKYQYSAYRKAVPIARNNYPLYSSRLVAGFLLGLMEDERS